MKNAWLAALVASCSTSPTPAPGPVTIAPVEVVGEAAPAQPRCVSPQGLPCPTNAYGLSCSGDPGGRAPASCALITTTRVTATTWHFCCAVPGEFDPR